MSEKPAWDSNCFSSSAPYTVIPFIRSVHAFPSSGSLASRLMRKQPPFRITRKTSASAFADGRPEIDGLEGRNGIEGPVPVRQGADIALLYETSAVQFSRHCACGRRRRSPPTGPCRKLFPADTASADASRWRRPRIRCPAHSIPAASPPVSLPRWASEAWNSHSPQIIRPQNPADNSYSVKYRSRNYSFSYLRIQFLFNFQ